MNIKPKLSDNTWEEIIYASENNSIPSTWKIGDEIDLTLSGTFNETVTLQIWDFKHFDKTDGSGKAGICFGMKNLMKDKQYMNTFYFNSGGWNECYMRNTVMNNVFNSMPIELRNAIKEVNTYANAGNRSKRRSKGLLSTDKVFLPGISEIDNEWKDQNRTETKQFLISIFKDEKNRIKRMNNGEGYEGWWCTRSPRYGYSDEFCILGWNGNSFAVGPRANDGVCFCFNI